MRDARLTGIAVIFEISDNVFFPDAVVHFLGLLLLLLIEFIPIISVYTDYVPRLYQEQIIRRSGCAYITTQIQNTFFTIFNMDLV